MESVLLLDGVSASALQQNSLGLRSDVSQLDDVRFLVRESNPSTFQKLKPLQPDNLQLHEWGSLFC